MAIDLRSDTVTQPDHAMRAVIAAALVGDDSYREDTSVNELEQYCAELFRKEAALFTSTGTMSNQLAIRSLTKPGDEVILDALHHIYYFESAQTADMARVTLNVCNTPNGVLTTQHLSHALSRKPRSAAYSAPTLVCVENTISCHAGRVFPLEELRDLYSMCLDNSMSLYMDGARILNACIATGTHPSAYARHVTALSLCFAKGLGAPFGAALIGNAAFIATARKYRKWYGGALHQAGMFAAGALYAIRGNYSRLAADHSAARRFAQALASVPHLHLDNVETNIVMFDVEDLNVTATAFVDEAKLRGVLLIPWTLTLVRAVTHLGVSERDVDEAASIVAQLCHQLSQERHPAMAR
jgi:threonine aldolase